MRTTHQERNYEVSAIFLINVKLWFTSYDREIWGFVSESEEIFSIADDLMRSK